MQAVYSGPRVGSHAIMSLHQARRTESRRPYNKRVWAISCLYTGQYPIINRWRSHYREVTLLELVPKLARNHCMHAETALELAETVSL